MRDLNNFTEEELLNELKRRQELETPVQFDIIDDSGIRSMLNVIVTSLKDGTYHEDNDDAEYLYDEVFKAYYGKKFFKWMEKMTNN